MVRALIYKEGREKIPAREEKVDKKKSKRYAEEGGGARARLGVGVCCGDRAFALSTAPISAHVGLSKEVD